MYSHYQNNMSTACRVHIIHTLAPNSTKLARFWTDLATSVRVLPAAEDGGSARRDSSTKHTLLHVTWQTGGFWCAFSNNAYQQWCWTFWGWGWLDRSVLERQSHWKNRWGMLDWIRTSQEICRQIFKNSGKHLLLLFTLQLLSAWWCWWAISAAPTFVDSHRWTLMSWMGHHRDRLIIWACISV